MCLLGGIFVGVLGVCCLLRGLRLGFLGDIADFLECFDSGL